MKDDGDDAGCHDEVEDLQLFYASLMMYRRWGTYDGSLPHKMMDL